jgi:dolichol-phosphate mannosyltransferase
MKIQWKERFSLIMKILHYRFIKFAVVGFSGMIVNLAVLYFSQEHVFQKIEPVGTRLNFSLALAIFCATVNNFFWNRIWTWGERKEMIHKAFPLQLGQYFLACWFSILCQFIITRIMVQFTHYLVANSVAIILSAVINYFLNDVWTFGVKKTKRRKRHPRVKKETASRDKTSPAGPIPEKPLTQ